MRLRAHRGREGTGTRRGCQPRQHRTRGPGSRHSIRPRPGWPARAPRPGRRRTGADRARQRARGFPSPPTPAGRRPQRPEPDTGGATGTRGTATLRGRQGTANRGGIAGPSARFEEQPCLRQPPSPPRTLPWMTKSTVHRAALLDFRRVAGHLFQDVDREDDVQRDETHLSLQLLMAFIEFHDDGVVRPNRRVSPEDPLRHLGPFAGLHGLDPIARPFRERDDVFCQPYSPPLLRELLEMVDRLAIILDRDLDV